MYKINPLRKDVISYCHDCNKDTNHESKGYYPQKEEITTDTHNRNQTNHHYIVKCKGCNNVSFLIISRGRESSATKMDKPFEYKETYPFSIADSINSDSNQFLSETETNLLPVIVRNLYNEIEQVYSTHSLILLGMGLRSLLDAICLHQKATGRNLKDKLDNLHKNGHIATNDLQILHKLRDIGNITVHEIKSPTSPVIDYSIEIINHTLRSIYKMPTLGKKLKR